jgi:hypothetical protein
MLSTTSKICRQRKKHLPFSITITDEDMSEHQIINAYLGLQALRQAGYRSTATAVAELVDNSIEAKAKNIDIFACSADGVVQTRRQTQVYSVAVLDDGQGMAPEVLSRCLSMGWGTRLETRNGLGRFGFGLKGSSLSQARRVDVYSWQAGEKPLLAYLDLQEIKDKGSQFLTEPEEASLPSWVDSNYSHKIGKSGTLVVWSQMDQMDLKRPDTLVSRVNKDLCRIYRHFLDDNDDYGKRRSITINHYSDAQKAHVKDWTLRANDPLYLLTPNNLPGHDSEATNVLQESYNLPVTYERDGKDCQTAIRLTFSVALPEIQNLGGASAVGKHYLANTGVSFVREGREIDFGHFGFFDTSDYRHRWWGAEVRFPADLDELFGVTNNKQEVRNIKKLSDEEKEDYAESGVSLQHKLVLDLNQKIGEQIVSMMSTIKSRKEGSRSKPSSKASGLIDKVNDEVAKDKTTLTDSQKHIGEKSREELIKEKAQLLLNDDSTLSEDAAASIAETTIDYVVELLTNEWPGSIFLDRKLSGAGSAGVLNRGTDFYDHFWEHLKESEDSKGYDALRVVLMAMIRTEDELAAIYDSKIFIRYREKLGEHVEKLLPLINS